MVGVLLQTRKKALPPTQNERESLALVVVVSVRGGRQNENRY